MSNSSKCLTLGAATDAGSDELAPSSPIVAPPGGRRLGEDKVRRMENWIVVVVTMLSATVILVTLWSHRGVARESGPPAQVAIGGEAASH
jgi:hypothetical protein